MHIPLWSDKNDTSSFNRGFKIDDARIHRQKSLFFREYKSYVMIAPRLMIQRDNGLLIIIF